MKKTTADKYGLKSVETNRRRKLQAVRIALMRVCLLAQRELRPAWVEYLYMNFDPLSFDNPKVSYRDGYYYIMDGQHRIEAAKKFLGEWEEQSIDCWVYEGLSEKDEARMFLELNDNLGVSLYDKFKAAVHAELPEETSILRVVESLNLRISRLKTPNSVGAVGALMKVHKRDGADTLRRSLQIIRDAYGVAGFDAYTIDGFAKLCQRYNGSLNDPQAISSLAKVHGGLNGLLNRAEGMRAAMSASKSDCIAAAAIDIINHNLGRGKKLASWFKALPQEKRRGRKASEGETASD